MSFIVGEKYTKKSIYEILGVPVEQRRGNWDTGYTRYSNEFFIFCNIGIPGRTGHDYNNEWEEDKLVWFAKKHTNINQLTIKDLLSNNYVTHIFTRTNDRSPFLYEGRSEKFQVYDTTPVKIVWQFPDRSFYKEISLPEELSQANGKYMEGSVRQILVNKYERSITAKRICLEHYGYNCQICDFNFYGFYGEIGKDFIHVHHIKPLSIISKEYQVNPVDDLVPVCPNCHAIIHSKNPCYTIEEMRKLIQDKSKLPY